MKVWEGMCVCNVPGYLRTNTEWYIKEEAMKVQHKVEPHIQWTVMDESPKYYIVQDTPGHKSALAKTDYEPVQEWVDETGVFDGEMAMQLLQGPGYRLVRHGVVDLHSKRKAYAYLLEREKQ